MMGIDQLFNQAIEASTDAERAELLSGLDDSMQKQLQALLDAHREMGKFLDGEPKSEAGRPDEQASLVGESIGPYEIVEKLGEGGFGVVYRAQQAQPIQRSVALKVIKPGMDSRSVVSRFQAERQALALMDHPNIARVIDAGMTESGHPYFVMDLVPGVPITKYCVSHQLSLIEKLELFIDVCQGVQHAHQKGVIHRDLKPTNILVRPHDRKSVPTIIDFGVAKSLDSELLNQSMTATEGNLIGTPIYMSPEQTQFGSSGVDTRSDVYSLGVVLYEILTGSTPLDKRQFEIAGINERLRMICEYSPPRPSARVKSQSLVRTSSDSDSTTEDSRRLSDLLKKDLDWIVMKCLEKDRERRYVSAAALAEDIQRYLAGKEVQAYPPSTMYRLRKFTQRNQAAILGVTLLICSMMIGTVVSMHEAFQAGQARAMAETETKKAKTAKKESDVNLAAALDAFQQILAHSSDPELRDIPRAQTIRKRMLTDALAFYEKVEKSAGESPETRYQAAMTRMQLSDLTLFLDRNVILGHELIQTATEDLDRLVREFPREIRYRVAYANALNESANAEVHLYLGGADTRRQILVRHVISLFERSKSEYVCLIQLDPTNRGLHRNSVLKCDISRASCMLRFDHELEEAAAIAEGVRKAIMQQSPEHGSDRLRLLAPATSVLARAIAKSDPERAKSMHRTTIELVRQGKMATETRNERNSYTLFLGFAVQHFLDYGSAEELDEALQYVDEGVRQSTELTREYPMMALYHHSVHNHCHLTVDILHRKLAIAREHNDDQAAEQISNRIDEFIERAARDYGVHAIQADAQANRSDNVAVLTESIKCYPDACVYYLRRGIIYRDQGDFKRAFADLDRAVELLPDHPLYPYAMDLKPHYERGLLHMTIGDYQQAVADFSDYLKVNPHFARDPSAYKHRASANFSRGKYTEALEDLQRAMDMAPKDPSTLTWIRPTKFADCPDLEFKTVLLRLADRMVELNEGSLSSRLRRAQYLIEMGRIDLALEDLSKLASTDVGKDVANVQLVNNIAWTLATTEQDAQRNPEMAVELARKITVEVDSQKLTYWNTLGVALYSAGRYEEALVTLELAETKKPADADFNPYNGFFIAMSHWQLGDHDEARRVLKLSETWNEHPYWNSRELRRFRSQSRQLIRGRDDSADSQEASVD